MRIRKTLQSAQWSFCQEMTRGRLLSLPRRAALEPSDTSVRRVHPTFGFSRRARVQLARRARRREHE